MCIGIAYTSLQIKRMTKRVIRGLPPVPTEQEENERIHRLRQEERETQDELAGMLFNKDDEKDEDAVDDDDDASGNDDVKDNTEPDEDVEEDDEDDDKDDVEEETKESANTDSKPQKKKARSKPVPADYVCFACKNAQNPLHWIYDCPDKIRNPGTNLIKKKQRGVFDPSSRKVFVTGLPFEAKSKEVEAYFENEMKCGKVVYCKLLLFEDSKRCRGNGFVTFDTDEGAQKALELNGATSFSIGEQDEKGKKELKLGVKKVLNRTQTNKRTYSKR